jgi:hypothetical protein
MSAETKREHSQAEAKRIGYPPPRPRGGIIRPTASAMARAMLRKMQATRSQAPGQAVSSLSDVTPVTASSVRPHVCAQGEWRFAPQLRPHLTQPWSWAPKRCHLVTETPNERDEGALTFSVSGIPSHAIYLILSVVWDSPWQTRE